MQTVHIEVDGVIQEVPSGISVAAAVLGHDHSHKAFHHNSMDASPREPYCLMGVCFECMLEIDDVPNVQSCLVTVREGMRVKRQKANAPFSYEQQENQKLQDIQEVQKIQETESEVK